MLLKSCMSRQPFLQGASELHKVPLSDSDSDSVGLKRRPGMDCMQIEQISGLCWRVELKLIQVRKL